ncbi:M48 family metallopeptidase [Robiginitomaculum antarcticum]|uniref:M48 family metallopeptidase n=1 Tax=Robiginitomaculum antarcticum TaxID=437507 RepID=UPI000375D12D|nr:SprT family zinc-dependent metalloprotease [Robiginitomaculum antarcticum]
MLLRRKQPKTKAPAFRERDNAEPRLVYTVNNRAKNISIKMDAAKREMIVTAPNMRNLSAARAFARDKADWISVHLEKLPEAQPFINGGQIMFRGAATQVLSPVSRDRPKYLPAQTLDSGVHVPPRLLVPAPPGALSGRMRRFLIRQAREQLEARTLIHTHALDLRPANVTVRDTRSRWGSCAASGDISYSWRLICAPDWVLDYVCAHEVAHRIEMNHSRAFWNIVDDLVDTAKPGRKWLRDHGAKLHAVGADY